MTRRRRRPAGLDAAGPPRFVTAVFAEDLSVLIHRRRTRAPNRNTPTNRPPTVLH